MTLFGADQDNVRDPAAGGAAGDPEAAADAAAEGGQLTDEQIAAAEEQAAEVVEEDLDELTLATRKADEYLDLARRTQADFENYRKRMAKDVSSAEERGVAKLAREIISALDNLDLSLAAISANGDAEAAARGFELVRDELRAGLARAGVEVDDPSGRQFDPQLHEAIAQVPADEGVAPNTVVQVHQVGYLMGETVIRAAKVAVAAGSG